MELFEAINNRRSIRKFKKDYIVSEEEIKILLEAGMSSPSALNARPYEFIVVSNKEIKNKLYEAHPRAKMILEASIVIVCVARPDLQKSENDYFAQDLGAVTENILLAATGLGLGSCWCGVYPNEERVQKVSKILSIDKGIPFNYIVIGKADETPIKRGYYQEEKVTFLK